MRERSLAESRRSREQHVVENFRTSPRRGNRHPENLLGPFVPDDLGERTRPQRKVELPILLDADARRHPPFDFGGTFHRTQRGVEIEILMWLTFRQAAPPMICESSVPNYLRPRRLPRSHCQPRA